MQVEVTRHYSGFRNAADSFEIGNHEAHGNAAMTRYTLPPGYTVNDYRAIVDPAGWECEIVPGVNGDPLLVSRGGACPDTALLP